jgi:hypothetical protein
MDLFGGSRVQIYLWILKFWPSAWAAEWSGGISWECLNSKNCPRQGRISELQRLKYTGK